MSSKRKRAKRVSKAEINKFLSEVDPIIKGLTRRIRIIGMEPDDFAQEIRLRLIKEYSRYKTRKLGWWFYRVRWLILGFIRKIRKSKEPLNHSIPFNELSLRHNDRRHRYGK